MKLTIESAEYRVEQGHPYLALKIGGREALLDVEPKPTLLEAGYAFLGSEWEDAVPTILFDLPGVTPTRLRGFTDDPTIVALYRRFLAALADGTFAVGPISIEPIPEHARGFENPDLMPGDDELLDAINDRLGREGH